MLLKVYSGIIYNSKIMETSQYPLTDEWIKKMSYIHIMEYYLAIRKDEISPFTSAWVELEGIMLSEISQLEKHDYHIVSLVHAL